MVSLRLGQLEYIKFKTSALVSNEKFCMLTISSLLLDIIRFMQKFGLQRNSSSRHSAIELEIVREKASALGRAGKKLRISLENHEKLSKQKKCINQEQQSIKEISNNVWELMLQREFLGFIENNLKWVTEHYLIPDEAIKNLGR